MAVDISRNLEAIREKVTAIHERQIQTDFHLKSIIGPPSLEERLKQNIDDSKRHVQANADQKLLQAQEIMRLQGENVRLTLESQLSGHKSELLELKVTAEKTETTRVQNHEANDRRIRKIEHKMYMALGAIATLQFLIDFVMKVVWK